MASDPQIVLIHELLLKLTYPWNGLEYFVDLIANISMECRHDITEILWKVALNTINHLPWDVL
jgi:hypothetical protein